VNHIFSSLPNVALLDFRGVHQGAAESAEAYWGPEKCTTMRHLANLALMLKRRKYVTRLLVDTQ
jgi:hypothetical protein